MYNIDIVMKSLSLYGENKSFRKLVKYSQSNLKWWFLSYILFQLKYVYFIFNYMCFIF